MIYIILMIYISLHRLDDWQRMPSKLVKINVKSQTNNVSTIEVFKYLVHRNSRPVAQRTIASESWCC